MAAVVLDAFGHLVVGLSEIDDAAFSLPPVDEIVYDTVLVAFTNQIIKDDYFGLYVKEPDICFGGGFFKKI